MVEVGKSTVEVNKPIYLGASIVDISKILMYKFHYEYIKPMYGENVKLLMTDTDSLNYEIKTPDFEEDIKNDISEWFTIRVEYQLE